MVLSVAQECTVVNDRMIMDKFENGCDLKTLRKTTKKPVRILSIPAEIQTRPSNIRILLPKPA
jgi:hypothetical protein